MPVRATPLMLVLLSSAASTARFVEQAADHASVVQKVIEMLQENKMKVAADLTSDEQQMAEYSKYCDDQISDKGYAIKTAARKIQDLQAVIDDAVAVTRGTATEIAQLGTSMAAKEQDIAAATAQRNEEKADLGAKIKELDGSINMIDRAIMAVKRQAGFLQMKEQGPSAIEAVSNLLGKVIDAAWVSQSTSSALKGFLQQRNDDSADASELDLARHQDKPQDGGIVQILEDMKTKAEETLSDTRMAEMKSNHNYQMMKQSLLNGVNLAKKNLADAQATTAASNEEKSDAEGELAPVKTAKVADQVSLRQLQRDCKAAAEEWGVRQQEAKGEMEAINQAVQILAERVKVLVQHVDDYVGDDAGWVSPDRSKLVEHLKSLSHRFSSYALAELAGAAAADPFAKVRSLVEDMVAKLVAEQNEQATQKDFCDEETEKSQKEKREKMMQSDNLANRIEVATSAKEKLQEYIKELHSEISQIDAATSDAAKIRAEGRNSYLKTSKDYKEGAAAVEDAVKVLKEYYASVSSLTQVHTGRKQPELGAAKGDSASVIIGMLENTGSNFMKMYMEAEADEQEAASGYEKNQQESNIARVAKASEIKGSESEIKSLEVALAGSSEDLKMARKELDAVLDYMDKLRPQCETKVMSYAEKKARRQAEIDGLKEALAMLDSQALLQTRRH